MTQATQAREPRLGIDIGRVITDGPSHPGGDTAFFSGDEATMLATPEMAGCAAAVARLAELFGGRVWLVSKCGPRIQARTLRWLDARDFWARAGLGPGRARFCRERREKRGHCEELRLTHFIDDHPDVHTAIRGAVDFQYFFGPQRAPVPPTGSTSRPGPTCSLWSRRPWRSRRRGVTGRPVWPGMTGWHNRCRGPCHAGGLRPRP